MTGINAVLAVLKSRGNIGFNFPPEFDKCLIRNGRMLFASHIVRWSYCPVCYTSPVLFEHATEVMEVSFTNLPDQKSKISAKKPFFSPYRYFPNSVFSGKIKLFSRCVRRLKLLKFGLKCVQVPFFMAALEFPHFRLLGETGEIVRGLTSFLRSPKRFCKISQSQIAEGFWKVSESFLFFDETLKVFCYFDKHFLLVDLECCKLFLIPVERKTFRNNYKSKSFGTFFEFIHSELLNDPQNYLRIRALISKSFLSVFKAFPDQFLKRFESAKVFQKLPVSPCSTLQHSQPFLVSCLCVSLTIFVELRIPSWLV